MQTQKKKVDLQEINGILLLDKPEGCSSNFILQRVRYLFKAKKAGHTGSLDPLATGMLPICFGEATKFSEYILNADKCYEVTAKLGETTTTGDAHGEIITQCLVNNLTETDLRRVISGFIGSIEQVPPMYSALKHNGQPLYKYARSGITIERVARTINIYAIDLVDINTNSFKLLVKCSKGTYIRTLIEDIGRTLGVGAHVTQLRRIYTAGFETQQMFTVSELESMSYIDLNSCLLEEDIALQYLPKVYLNAEQAQDLYHGKLICDLNLSNIETDIIRIYNLKEQKFMGIGKKVENHLKAQRLMALKA